MAFDFETAPIGKNFKHEPLMVSFSIYDQIYVVHLQTRAKEEVRDRVWSVSTPQLVVTKMFQIIEE